MESKNPFKRIWKHVKPGSSKPKADEKRAESQQELGDHGTFNNSQHLRVKPEFKQPSSGSETATNEAQDTFKSDAQRSPADSPEPEVPVTARSDQASHSDIPTKCTQEVLSETRSGVPITSLVLSKYAPNPFPTQDTGAVGPPSTVAHQPSIWEMAFSTLDNDLVDSYKSILIADKDIKGDPFHPTTMNTLVQKELAVISKRQWSIKIPFIPHRVLIRTIVDKLVAAFKIVKDFGATAAALDPVHAGLPFAAICMILPLLTNDSEEQKKALDGIDETADLIILYSVTEKWCLEPNPNELVKKFTEKLETLYSQISTFLVKAVCHFNRGTLSRIGHSIPKCDDWGGQLQRIQESDQKCRMFIESIRAEDQKSDLVSVLSLLTAQESRLIQFMKDLDLNTKKNEEIIHWVSTAEIETDHQEVREKLGRRYWGSGQWFWPEYSEWSSPTNFVDVFWLCGSVGKGKSSIVSIVIEWYREHLQSQDQVVEHTPEESTSEEHNSEKHAPEEPKIEQRLAFFYCDKGQRGDPVHVLRSLVAQLAWAVDGNSISKAVQNEYDVRKESQRLGAKLSMDECSTLLNGLVSNKKVMIVIDSLDQCDDPQKLLLYLHQLSTGPNSAVKLFFSSRPEVRVLDVFFGAQKVDLDSSERSTKVDMENFVRSQVYNRTELNIGPRLLNGERRDLEDKLVRIVTSKSQGMFRWAELQLEIFLGPHTRLRHSTDIEKKLDELEAQTGLPELDGVYEQIFDNNTGPQTKGRDIAITSFQILISAQRPLQISELVQAASINCEGNIDKEVNEQFLLRICSNFIVASLGSVVQFAHASAREYLQGRKDEEMSTKDCHHKAAETCLAYLCLPSISIRDTKDFNSDFLGYAIVYWTIHWENVKDIASDFLQSLLEQFIGTGGRSSCLAEWTEALPLVAQYLPQGSNSMREKISDAMADPPNTFWPACVWRFPEIVRNHAQDPAVDLQLALFIASKYGHADIVSQLLKEDLDVNAGVRRGLTALHTAAERGHDAVVKFLLQHKASADVEDANGVRPLYMAAVNGEQAVVGVLLEKVGDVDAKTDTMMGGGETALLRAAWNGHQGIVELLLEKNADYNAQSPYGETVLYGAACNGHTEVVKSLLKKMKKKKIEVNIQTGSGETALHWAAWNGYPNIVSLLLEDAEVNLANNQGETALYGAAWNGHKKVVEFLLKAGAKDLPTRSGDTPALRARRNRREGIEKLIEKSEKRKEEVGGASLL